MFVFRQSRSIDYSMLQYSYHAFSFFTYQNEGLQPGKVFRFRQKPDRSIQRDDTPVEVDGAAGRAITAGRVTPFLDALVGDLDGILPVTSEQHDGLIWYVISP